MDQNKVKETSKVLEFKRPDLNEMRSFLQDDLFNDEIIERILREFETDLGQLQHGPSGKTSLSKKDLLENKLQRLEEATDRVQFYLDEISLHYNLD